MKFPPLETILNPVGRHWLLHNNHTTIAPMSTSCLAGPHCSIQGPVLVTSNDIFSPCTAFSPSGTRKTTSLSCTMPSSLWWTTPLNFECRLLTTVYSRLRSFWGLSLLIFILTVSTLPTGPSLNLQLHFCLKCKCQCLTVLYKGEYFCYFVYLERDTIEQREGLRPLPLLHSDVVWMLKQNCFVFTVSLKVF